MTNGERINWLQKFEQHKLVYSYLALALYLLLNNSINATSVWMEYSRDPHNQLRWWEPFVWEYSSALATLLLSPLLWFWFDRHPPRLSNLRNLLLVHLVGSLLFSLSHSVLMVGLRQLVYATVGRTYDFSPWLRELFYEYRKDVWGYLFFFGLYQLLQFVYLRLTGDARLISSDDEVEADVVPATAQQTPSPTNGRRNAAKSDEYNESDASDEIDAGDESRESHFDNNDHRTIHGADQRHLDTLKPARANAPQHFLVRKLDKEFLVAIADIEWLEASGNYVNLHSKGRIYPLRATLSHTMLQLEVQGFSRIHRSYAVNHRHIDNISYQPSGDGELVLKNGQQLALSRRYKDQFRTRFQLIAG